MKEPLQSGFFVIPWLFSIPLSPLAPLEALL